VAVSGEGDRKAPVRKGGKNWFPDFGGVAGKETSRGEENFLGEGAGFHKLIRGKRSEGQGDATKRLSKNGITTENCEGEEGQLPDRQGDQLSTTTTGGGIDPEEGAPPSKKSAMKSDKGRGSRDCQGGPSPRQ